MSKIVPTEQCITDCSILNQTTCLPASPKPRIIVNYHLVSNFNISIPVWPQMFTKALNNAELELNLLPRMEEFYTSAAVEKWNVGLNGVKFATDCLNLYVLQFQYNVIISEHYWGWYDVICYDKTWSGLRGALGGGWLLQHLPVSENGALSYLSTGHQCVRRDHHHHHNPHHHHQWHHS